MEPLTMPCLRLSAQRPCFPFSRLLPQREGQHSGSGTAPCVDCQPIFPCLGLSPSQVSEVHGAATPEPERHSDKNKNWFASLLSSLA